MILSAEEARDALRLALERLSRLCDHLSQSELALKGTVPLAAQDIAS